MPQRWTTKLSAANTNDEVMKIVREFLIAQPQSLIERLPSECRPPLMKNADDVMRYAITLIKKQYKLDEETEGLFYEFAAFFTTAHNKLTRLMT
jgi:hypothetical protein